ncbi:transcriptional regulator [Paenibacillus sp. 5J-6]|uniref:Transcriptional regulator n=1 Tax=Paenibacillus silvestris TaxID=2606219 RepID=A0A6L8V6R8_9BACL|nr:helix-turn-helix domain-containing protein [Paenibacillus silvestris]MZQ85967.1 transcriptional regulator [Paenibacillus silvestris]
MIHFNNVNYRCTSEIFLHLISGKWKVPILNLLSNGTLRFNELQRQLPEATQRMLTMQLRDLERDGLVIRKVYPVAPPKVEYYLSDLGLQTVPILQMLYEFGATYVENFQPQDPDSMK